MSHTPRRRASRACSAPTSCSIPTAIGWHPAEKSEFGAAQVDAWRTIQRSHAIANGVFVASPNRIGHEDDEPGTDGIEFFGHSFIADPFGRILAEAPNTEEAILIAKCDPKLIEDTRRNWPFLRDRRIDAYAPILSQVSGRVTTAEREWNGER